jgi:hypothetical protein
MSHPTVITREHYLAMTPSVYLRSGFRDDAGRLRPELYSIWATAGATQLEALTSNELATTLLALAQTLPLHTTGTLPDRYRNAVAEAQELAVGLLRRPPNPHLGRWLTQFAPHLHTDQDLEDLLAHLCAVARQHSLFAGMRAAAAQAATA